MSSIIALGVGNRSPFLPPPPLTLSRWFGNREQRRLPVQRADHLEVLRTIAQHRRVDVGGVADQPERAVGIGLGQLAGQCGGARGGLMPGLALLAVESPEHRQAEVAIGAKRQRDGDAQDDPVQAEPQRLVFLRRKHSVEEDAAEGDLGAALVAERIVHDHQTTPPGIKWLRIRVARTMPKSSHSQAAEWKTA